VSEIIRAENIKKCYKLGEIGGRTLLGSSQSFFARLFGKDDPNTKIGSKNYDKNETFTALDDVSFSINKGETVGIIGRNGAGKSTLLKILSRITAPTDGCVYLDGRVSSMLEIGTGFHAELTGRENIYLNGAILGMSRREVDEKLDDIIEFSECEQFIDTPIKRYSSGMYVKLAFAVAAHLNSEILIMDEVLAVGDAAFVRKCIEKMRSIAEEENRTILYVSHNMDTVKNLCTRTIVLDKGKIIYDGDTDEAIKHYLSSGTHSETHMTFDENNLSKKLKNKQRAVNLLGASYPSNANTTDENGMLNININWTNKDDITDLCFRLTVYDSTLKSVATSMLYDFYSGKAGQNESVTLSFDMSTLAPGRYETRYTLFRRSGITDDIESYMGLSFYKTESILKAQTKWHSSVWGSAMLPTPEIV